jgi:hypothetical protein
MSGATVAASLLSSAEAQGSFGAVTRLYEGVFPRIPDAGGVLYWRHRVTTGLSVPGVAANLVASAEFRSAHDAQSNATFVNAMYQQMLGRAPDSGGASYWTSMLDRGGSRATFVYGVATSTEFVLRWAASSAVNEVYIGMLRRTADAGGSSYWLGQIRSGMTPAAFVAAVYGSSEYAARF